MGAPPTIFISAYRNVSIRYILYSDIFKELRRRNVKIVVFLKDNDLEYYRQRLGDDNVIIEPVLFDMAMHQLRSNWLSGWFVITRRFMSGSESGYENTSANVQADFYGKAMSQTFKGFLIVQAIKFLAKLGTRVKGVRKGLVALESRMFPGEFYDRFFEKYSPQMLIISSLGYMIDPYFMRAAKRHGCKVVSIPHSWDNTSSKDYRGGDPDHIITWNEIMKREVNVFHDIPNERIYVGGIAHWDFYFNGQFKPRPKDEFLSSNGLIKGRKVILYGTTSPVTFIRTFDVIEQLLEAMARARFLFSCQLVVRLHPVYLTKDKCGEGQWIGRFQERIKVLRRRYGDLVSFTTPMMRVLNDDIDMPVEDMHHLAETLYHSDVLLTEYSTLIIEGAIFDLPVINVGLYNYRDTDKPASYWENYTHIRRILKTGATRNAYTIEQLIEYINFYLEERSQDKDRRKELVEQEVTTNRGCAGRMIAQYIHMLLEQ